MHYLMFVLVVIAASIVMINIHRMLKIYSNSLLNALKENIASYEQVQAQEQIIIKANKVLENEITRVSELYNVTKEMSACLTTDDLTSIVNKKLNELPKDNHPIIDGLANLQSKRIDLYQKVLQLAITDALTGVYVRRHFLERCNEELARARHQNLSLAILMLDIDHFKDINDRFGHLVGDVVLKEIARLITSNLREIDLLARYGGEEFVIALVDTPLDMAVVVAERIRKTIETTPVYAYDETIRATISIGVAVYPKDSALLDGLIGAADKALYKAKQKGRNQVCV